MKPMIMKYCSVVGAILFALGLLLLVKLGYWQLSRMAEKKAIVAAWALAESGGPVTLEDVLSGKVAAQSGMPVMIAAQELVLTDKVFLLNNQVCQGQVGYRVFKAALVGDDYVLIASTSPCL